MRKEISDLIPPYPVTHQNAWIGPEEVEHLDGETDDDGQVHPFVSVRNIPKYGSRREDDHRKVPKGMTQEERNKDHLMEWFAGWAIGHMEEFRKFTIISRLPHLERWKKWHHVSLNFRFCTVGQYTRRLADANSCLPRSKSKLPMNLRIRGKVWG
jgi:chromo domain-containing protein 1